LLASHHCTPATSKKKIPIASAKRVGTVASLHTFMNYPG
jgi:hypothetical protein